MAILRGNDKNATTREKHVGSNVAKVVTSILNFFCYNILIYGWCVTLASLLLCYIPVLYKKIAKRELYKGEKTTERNEN
jgi:hypothetical protein